MNPVICIDELPTSKKFREFAKSLAPNTNGHLKYWVCTDVEPAAKLCISCGAKTDARGSLPCGH